MNDCQACGACCAAFCVDFDRVELAGGEFAWAGGVPPLLAVPVTGRLWRMRGTDGVPPRCVALAGDVGRAVRCTIYAQRPGPCREFEASAEVSPNPACRRARARHGLLPLDQ
jgi:Fe-S-cluster containining protein